MARKRQKCDPGDNRESIPIIKVIYLSVAFGYQACLKVMNFTIQTNPSSIDPFTTNFLLSMGKINQLSCTIVFKSLDFNNHSMSQSRVSKCFLHILRNSREDKEETRKNIWKKQMMVTQKIVNKMRISSRPNTFPKRNWPTRVIIIWILCRDNGWWRTWNRWIFMRYWTGALCPVLVYM